MHACMHACMYVCMYVCTSVDPHIYMCGVCGAAGTADMRVQWICSACFEQVNLSSTFDQDAALVSQLGCSGATLGLSSAAVRPRLGLSEAAVRLLWA